MQDVFANGVETLFDIVIRIPKDRNAELLHRLVPDGIVRLPFVGIMLASVEFDDQASGWNVKIGYVPKEDNIVFSRLMDAGKLLFGKITAKALKGKWLKINIGIYLHE